MEGWIKIHRGIKDHWIWKSDHRLKWWLDILLTVNHADSKILIKGKLIECKRGQSVRSLETWAKDWNVTKKTVKEFFELLQKDSMLLYESIQISTRITVCNYDNYQDVVNVKETKGKRKVNGEETDTTPKQEGEEGIKNEKNERELKARAIIFYNSIAEYKDQYSKEMLRKFYNHWIEPNKSKTKMKFEMEKTWDLSLRLIKWESNEKIFNKGKNGEVVSSVPYAGKTETNKDPH